MRKLIRTTSPVERLEEMSVILGDFTRHLNQVWCTRQEKDATCINSLRPIMKFQDDSSCRIVFEKNVNISGADNGQSLEDGLQPTCSRECQRRQQLQILFSTG